MWLPRLCPALVAALATACATGTGDFEAGDDAGIPRLDGADPDAGGPAEIDSSPTPMDSGPVAHDAGSVDSGHAGGPDSATVDSGSVDSGSHGEADSSTGGVPTTCAQANESFGCCDPAGVLFYCQTGSTSLVKKSCTGTKVCGWDSTSSYYNCVAAPGGDDPSGTHAMACQ
jgi:hypothetical protein